MSDSREKEIDRTNGLSCRQLGLMSLPTHLVWMCSCCEEVDALIKKKKVEAGAAEDCPMPPPLKRERDTWHVQPSLWVGVGFSTKPLWLESPMSLLCGHRQIKVQ